MIEYLKVIGFMGQDGQRQEEMFDECQIVLVAVTSPQLNGGDGPQAVHPLHINEIYRNGLIDVKMGDQFTRYTRIVRLHDSDLETKKLEE